MNRQRLVLLITLIFVLVLVSHPVHADEARVSLADLVAEAIAQNPEIQASQSRWNAAKSVVPQVTSLPDPLVTMGYRGDDIMNESRFGIQQEFPFPGKLKLKGDVAMKRAQQTQEASHAIRLRVIAQLKEAYFTLHFVHESVEIVRKNLKILAEFEKTAEARYKVGKGIQQDVFRAQVELSRELERLTNLEQQEASAQADINRILNRPPDTPLGIPEEPELTELHDTLEDLRAMAVKYSPLLKLQRRGIEQSEAAVKLARRQFYPDFTVSVSSMQNFDRGDRRDVLGLLGIRVPLFYATKQRNGVKEARSTLQGSKRDYQTVLQDIRFRVKDHMVRAQRAARLVKLIGTAIIPQASLALESSIAGYSVGNVDFLTMLDNLLNLQQDELDLHRERTEHEIAIARLEEIVGVPLQEAGQ